MKLWHTRCFYPVNKMTDLIDWLDVYCPHWSFTPRFELQYDKEAKVKEYAARRFWISVYTQYRLNGRTHGAEFECYFRNQDELMLFRLYIGEGFISTEAVYDD